VPEGRIVNKFFMTIAPLFFYMVPGMEMDENISSMIARNIDP
jgi:hypothetical protein